MSKQLLIQDRWDFHFWKGLENKYPLCCILYFCNVQTNWGEQGDSLYERIYREAYESQSRYQGSLFNHAMCIDCMVLALQHHSNVIGDKK
jgi:hypothetical protein